MRIALNARSFLTKYMTGIGRYAYNLVQSLIEIDHNNQYLLYARKGLFDKRRSIPKLKARNLHTKVDWLNNGLYKTLGSIDIYHCPHPDVIPKLDAKIIVTVHDLVYKNYSDSHTSTTLHMTDKQMHSFLPKASKIICVSHHTKNDLMNHFNVEENKVCVIYQGVNKDVFYPIEEQERMVAYQEIRKIGVTLPFILFVGTIEPRKNLKNLLMAFSKLKEQKRFDGKLVVAGMKGWKSDDYEQILEKYHMKDHVITLGFVEDEILRYLYNCCEYFVFPSLYEGFGYPIVEAFSCGAAVIASNATSIPEVAQDAALNISPFDPDDMCENLRKLLEDHDLRKDLSKRALQRAKDFSFEKTARSTLAVYRKVYEN